MWSPASQKEADEDASIRPLPPSSPPSPSPSRSNSSYLSDPRTFRSMAASTKPTTLLSIDLHGNGMAHIAQAPLTPTSQVGRMNPHTRNLSSNTNGPLLGSAASITFSALPPDTTSRPTSLLHPNSITNNPTTHNDVPLTSVQAPLHTYHHPRNNPRPSSPPLDNASMLTLASSAYAMSGPRPEASLRSTPFSALGGGGDSMSHFGGGGSVSFADAESVSQFVTGDDDRLDDRDVDASVRALRPRSSRRGSWESESSRWSARDGLGTPSVTRDFTGWSSPSVKSGKGERTSADNVRVDSPPTPIEPITRAPTLIEEKSDTEKSLPSAIDGTSTLIPSITERQLSSDTVAEVTGANKPEPKKVIVFAPLHNDDMTASVVSLIKVTEVTDYLIFPQDDFHSAPSTPLT